LAKSADYITILQAFFNTIHPTLPFLEPKMDGGYRGITRRRQRIRAGLSGQEDPFRQVHSRKYVTKK